MPRILDTFCKAGGAGMGYSRAGFDVVGVDIQPQPRYPFPFILGDALEILRRMIAGGTLLATDGSRYGLKDFDAIHASPPCQRYSTISKYAGVSQNYPDLVDPVRDLLILSGLPYDIENVIGAPLKNPLTLRGSMFGLNVRKHRIFETSYFVTTQPCNHSHPSQKNVQAVYGHPGGSSKRDGKKFGNINDWRRAMDINWMSAHELAEAIPPAYTEYIGKQLSLQIEKR